MVQLEFFGVGGRRVSSDNDACVTFSVSGNAKDKQCRFTISEQAVKKFAPNTEVFVYAISGSRLYFKESAIGVGYKLSTISSNRVPNRYVSISAKKNKDLYEFCASHAGRYSLNYDENLECYYIETVPTFIGAYGKEVM